jgi:hypothetical protein
LQTSGSKITTNKKNTLLALLTAGVLFTGGTFFAVPPAAFADHVGEEEHSDEDFHEHDLDIEVFDSDGREYFGEDNDEDVYVESACFEDTYGCNHVYEYCPEEDDDNDNNGHDNELAYCVLGLVDDDDDDDEDDDNDGRDGDYPETWINWVRTGNGKDVRNGGHTSSNSFVVDFKGTVEGHGSRIDFRIDDDPYYPVASPHSFSILSEGYHTISLRAVDHDEDIDPTPATWSFHTAEDHDYDGKDKKKNNKIDQKDIYKKINKESDEIQDEIEDSEHDVKNKVEDTEQDLNKKIEDSENDVQDTVKESEKDIKNKVEDSENDVIRVLEKKLNVLEKNISEEHAVQEEELEDIQDDIKNLKKGQKNLSEDLEKRIDRLEKKLFKAMEENEKALKAKIEDTEQDLKRKIEDSENDVIKQINALWDWLRDLVAAFAKALGLVAAEEADENKK